MQQLLQSEVIMLGSIFICVTLLVVAVAMMFQRDPAARRMKVFAQSSNDSNAVVSADAPLFFDAEMPKFLRIVEPLQRRLVKSDPKQVSEARQRLIEAGYYRRNAVEIYYAIRIMLGIASAGFAALYLFIVPLAMDSNVMLLSVVGGAAFGYYFPALALTAKIDGRRRKFKLGMPDALDMMLVGVEAGLSLAASMKHIVSEFAQAHPIVSEQFQIVSLEFQAGRSRAEALQNLATRMQLPETRMLASMIVQSETLGTSMAQTLQVMADELRMQRMLDAEKRAAELPVKMAIPLVLFFFPALMAVALVPAMINSLTFFAGINS